MAETAQEVFSLHRMQKHEPVLRGVHGTYLFDIDKVGSWFIAVDDGAIHVRAASFYATLRSVLRNWAFVAETLPLPKSRACVADTRANTSMSRAMIPVQPV